jgi:hypothetical protein
MRPAVRLSPISTEEILLHLQSGPGRAAVLGCVTTAVLTAGSFAYAAAKAPSTDVPPPLQYGGLPMSSLDGKQKYIPQDQVPGTKVKALRASPAATTSTPTGFDISWPQCGGAMPASSSVAIVGADDGHQFSDNPCLRQEAQWASTATIRGQYMVVDSPDGSSSANVLKYAYSGPAGSCTATEYECLGFNWGYNDAYDEVSYANSQGATSADWWLDVELPDAGSINPTGSNCYVQNYWSCDTDANAAVVLGAVEGLSAQGKQVGIYSTQSQWQSITGGFALGVPIWIAGWNGPASTYCDTANSTTDWFAMGIPSLVQSLPGTYDPDTACA